MVGFSARETWRFLRAHRGELAGHPPGRHARARPGNGPRLPVHSRSPCRSSRSAPCTTHRNLQPTCVEVVGAARDDNLPGRDVECGLGDWVAASEVGYGFRQDLHGHWNVNVSDRYRRTPTVPGATARGDPRPDHPRIPPGCPPARLAGRTGGSRRIATGPDPFAWHPPRHREPGNSILSNHGCRWQVNSTPASHPQQPSQRDLLQLDRVPLDLHLRQRLRQQPPRERQVLEDARPGDAVRPWANAGQAVPCRSRAAWSSLARTAGSAAGFTGTPGRARPDPTATPPAWAAAGQLVTCPGRRAQTVRKRGRLPEHGDRPQPLRGVSFTPVDACSPPGLL